MNPNPTDDCNDDLDDTRDRFYCANCDVTFVQPPAIQKFYDVAICPGCDLTALNTMELDSIRDSDVIATMDDLFE